MTDRKPAPVAASVTRSLLFSAVVAGIATASVAATVLIAATSPVPAQDYPSRPVRIIVPFPAGGTADAMPRLISDWLARKWGQPVVIENRTGAAGNIGSETAFKAEPDGYTLLSAPPPPLVINHNLYPKLGFDPTEFVPIIIISRVPNALVVNPKVKANTLAEFIADARANPGKITAATQGNGSTSHLTAELFQLMAQVKFQNVPYRGSAPALQDLVAGNVEIMFDNLGVSLPLVKGGQLKLIAVATEKRMASLPQVPAIAETLPGFEAAAWYGVVAPPKTSKAIVDKINADINEALKSPEIAQRLPDFSAEAVGGTPQETAAYMREEVERWHKVIKAAGVKLE
jgi:tripartite-type tricarboxylate transporter receptor subunit TctC